MCSVSRLTKKPQNNVRTTKISDLHAQFFWIIFVMFKMCNMLLLLLDLCYLRMPPAVSLPLLIPLQYRYKCLCWSSLVLHSLASTNKCLGCNSYSQMYKKNCLEGFLQFVSLFHIKRVISGNLSSLKICSELTKLELVTF